MVDGKSLGFTLLPYLRQEFLQLCTSCRAVVCCRVSPSQKADMVELVREHTGAITLTIGDGANDVAIVQKATRSFSLRTAYILPSLSFGYWGDCCSLRGLELQSHQQDQPLKFLEYFRIISCHHGSFQTAYTISSSLSGDFRSCEHPTTKANYIGKVLRIDSDG